MNQQSAMTMQVPDRPANEVFALTDEQILGMEPQEEEVASGERNASQHLPAVAATATASARDGEKGAQALRENSSGQAGMAVPQEPPGWLAREMKDPWVGDEARELWEGVQKAERETAAYREAFGSPEDARALKEIYPGGVAEAKGAAARARELAEIDAVFFGAAGKPAEELRAGRVALVEKLYAQDPGAFRAMVEAGVRILGKAPSGQRSVAGEAGTALAHDANNAHGSLRTAIDRSGDADEAHVLENSGAHADGKGAQPGMAMPQEVVGRYREFERATNAELERSVGGTIARAMEAALPNLRQVGGAGEGAPLQERLRGAVREEVEAALRCDASLGEQVAKVLSGRRFDEGARAQVVRLIDARAQQLVSGAVRKVVGAWTAATLGTTRKRETGAESFGGGEQERRSDGAVNSSRTRESGGHAGGRNERAVGNSATKNLSRGRVDYRKFSDEQILGM